MAETDGSYVECVLKIEASKGWELSVTKVLASFKDLCYEINPSLGLVYIKGIANPQIILMKLKKGGKHAKIEWISTGFPRDDQYQVQEPGSGHDNYPIHHDPSSLVRYPYQTYNQYNLPYYNWYNLAQNALPYRNHFLEHEPSEHSEGRSSCPSHHPHCPVHSNHHQSPLSTQGSHTMVQNSSPPPTWSQTNVQANNQPSSKKSSSISIKKIIQKFRSIWSCSSN